MRRFNNLLSKIADDLSIERGLSESIDAYKARIVYSVSGKMALASLWDNLEDGASVSVTHFKRRIEDIVIAYVSMYPELADYFPSDLTAYCEEIYDIYLQTGHIYHTPYRIASAMPQQSQYKDVVLTRGYSLDIAQSICGLGTYYTGSKSNISMTPNKMFRLSSSTTFLWDSVLSKAQWRDLTIDGQLEYLRTEPPFTRGYWKSVPTKDGIPSLLRITTPGSSIYYLYQYINKEVKVSQLPNWMTENHNYRELAIGCLMRRNIAIPIKYHVDGVTITLEQSFLLPPPELSFLKLYSWPNSCRSLSQFQRTTSIEMFNVISGLLSAQGHSFIEV